MGVRTAVLSVFLLALPALAQVQPSGAAFPTACGDPGVRFEVKTEKSQHPAAAPQEGKALVYFIEDDSEFGSIPKPTVRIGMDGAWVGATHGNSYFSISVTPGEHHLCVSWQSAVIIHQGLKMAAAHFTAAAGGVYFFEVRNTWSQHVGTARMTLSPLDSDEGQLQANSSALSNFQLKK